MTVPLAGESRTPLGSNSAVDPKGGVALPGWFLGNSSTTQAINQAQFAARFTRRAKHKTISGPENDLEPLVG
jgi:hypothetical protein